MFSLKEIRTDIFNLQFDEQIELNSHFLRFQEYYESPEFRGKRFQLIDYINWYAKENDGDFTYFNDWSGFNIPAEVLIDCYHGIPDLNDQDEFMYYIAKKAVKASQSGKAYLIGTTTDAKETTIHHELAHGMFYVNEEYQKKIISEIDKICHTMTFYQMMKWLALMGYAENVHHDELNAYLATGLPDKKETDVPDVSDELREPFIKLFKQYCE